MTEYFPVLGDELVGDIQLGDITSPDQMHYDATAVRYLFLMPSRPFFEVKG